MIVVGVSGKLGSGKDTVAKYLIEKYNFEKVSLADKLKEICMTYDDSSIVETFFCVLDICRDLFGGFNLVLMWRIYKLMKKVQPNGWVRPTFDECYKDKTAFSRRILQDVGDGMRHIKRFYDPRREQRGLPAYYDYEDVWIDFLLKRVEQYQEGQLLKVVIPDVRYINEVRKIRKFGGEVWRVQRSIDQRKINQGERTEFISETQLDNYQLDRYIDNNNTVEKLYRQVDDITKEHEDLHYINKKD